MLCDVTDLLIKNYIWLIRRCSLNLSTEVPNGMFSYYLTDKQDNDLLWGVWSGDIRPHRQPRGEIWIE